MDLAIIAPESCLTRFCTMSKYHLVLAHLLEDKSRTAYRDFYMNRHSTREFVIMDNGAYELNESLPSEVLLKWCETLQPQEVVLPDVRTDPEATLKRTKQGISDLRSVQGRVRFMAVPQGETFADWQQNVLDILDLGSIDSLAIIEAAGRFSERGYRDTALNWLEEQHIIDSVTIHLFSIQDDPRELIYLAGRDYIRSCDSAKPVAYGLADIKLQPHPYWPPSRYPGRGDKFFDRPLPTLPQQLIVLNNIAVCSAWAHDVLGECRHEDWLAQE